MNIYCINHNFLYETEKLLFLFLPFEVKLPHEPLNINKMTSEELKKELEQGYQEMQEGKAMLVAEAFEDICKKYGL